MVKIKNYIYFIRGAGGHYFLNRELNIKMSCDHLNEYTPSDSQNKIIRNYYNFKNHVFIPYNRKNFNNKSTMY